MDELIDQLIEDYTPRISRLFRQAMLIVRNDIPVAELAEAIQMGDTELAFRLLGLSEGAMRPVTRIIERAFEEGGIGVGGKFPKPLKTPNGSAVFRFDVRNSRAERILRDQMVKLSTDLEVKNRDALQRQLQFGMERGLNPRETAVEIAGKYDRRTGNRVGGIVGLDGPQTSAKNQAILELENMDIDAWKRRKLRHKSADTMLERMAANGEKLDRETIDGLINRYEGRMLKQRGDRIGRTESVSALNASKHEAMNQAKDMGAIKNKHVKRYWDDAGDDGRTREDHLIAGQYYADNPVGMDEPFIVGGVAMMYPGDRSTHTGNTAELLKQAIHCRCRERTEIDWIEAERENGST